MTTGAVQKSIREKIEAALSPERLEIVDESHRHAGHAASGGGGHMAVIVVAEAFEGMSRVARHRLVYRILNEEIGGPIHALALGAFTPAEWRSAPAEARRVSTLG